MQGSLQQNMFLFSVTEIEIILFEYFQSIQISSDLCNHMERIRQRQFTALDVVDSHV